MRWVSRRSAVARLLLRRGVGGAAPAGGGRSGAGAGGLRAAVEKGVEPGGADAANLCDLDVGDKRRVVREDALDADAVADAAHREVGVDAAALLAYDYALEHLNAVSLALDDLDVDTHGIARAKARDIAIRLDFYV